MVEQKSPDGGKSEFYYDRLGRLALSQNAKQRNNVSPGLKDWDYSFTHYDHLGRISAVGEVKNLANKEPVNRSTGTESVSAGSMASRVDQPPFPDHQYAL